MVSYTLHTTQKLILYASKKYTMEKIIITTILEHQIIFKITADTYDYFEGEFLYPFVGMKFEYFNDDNYLEEYSPKGLKIDVVGVFFLLYHQLISNYEAILEESKNHPELKISVDGNDRCEKTVNEYSQEKYRQYMHAYPGNYISKRIRESFCKSIVNLITRRKLDINYLSAKDYQRVYNEVHENNAESLISDEILEARSKRKWFQALSKDKEYGSIRLKTLTQIIINQNFSFEETWDVQMDVFLNPKDSRVPLFVGTQFGITPRLSPEQYEKLEGCKIAILGKSQLSGHVAGLGIYEIKNGQKVRLAYFNN